MVAHHRALESARPDALFHDPYAQRLAGGRGEEIARKLPWGRRMAWSTITRTVLMDEIVLRLVAQGVDTVLNLAAGMDARPYRLALPESLRWVEMDLPAMTATKTEFLSGDQPRCRLERVAVDLRDHAARRKALAECASSAKKALIMTEGLLIYLDEPMVSELARDLHQQTAIHYWMTDLASPYLVNRMQKWWGKPMKAANAWMSFGPADGTRFFEPMGWREAEFHELFLSSLRINRPMPFVGILKLQMKLFPKWSAKNQAKWRSGVVLLERKH
ncbi:MAG TPA: SAM-dependent methyltransferase [Terriglobia bacterium]|nr:SAM-dependent methyltransferase [Terriglobia bacterium]